MSFFKRTTGALFVPLLTLAVLTACGDSSDNSSASATVSTESSTGSQLPAGDAGEPTTVESVAEGSSSSAPDTAAFSECLKANGVELPEGFDGTGGGLGRLGNPGSLPDGLDLAALQGAFGKCGDKLPTGLGLPGAGQGGIGAALGGADFSAYTTCLKDNGLTIPEPFDPTKIDLADPAFSEATNACQVLLPSGLQGLNPGSAPTTVGA